MKIRKVISLAIFLGLFLLFQIENTASDKAYQSDGETVLLLHFDEKDGMFASDSSSYGKNGTLKNMEGTEWRPGKFANALHFDGANDYVDCRDIQNSEWSELTVEAWIMVDDLKIGDKSGVAVCENAYGGKGFSLYIDDLGRPVFNVGDANAKQVEVISMVTLETEKWYQLIGIFDGEQGTLKIFVDGEEKSSTVDISSVGDPNYIFTIGAENTLQDDPRGYFCGTIDEVRISKRIRKEFISGSSVGKSSDFTSRESVASAGG